jgi:hypothetical protein
LNWNLPAGSSVTLATPSRCVKKSVAAHQLE